MALIPINNPEYNLKDSEGKDIPGLEGVVFGPSSDEHLNQLQTVKFTNKQGMIPQSVLEAVAVRAHSDDPKAWDYQRTRLGAFYVVLDGKVHVAFDDIPDPKKNIVIARAQEGYDLNRNGKQLIIRGKTLQEVLKRAERDQRILEVPADGHVEASVEEYGANPYFLAIAGHMAPVNAQLIDRKYKKGHVWLLKPDTVLEQVKENEAVVRPVGLGVYCNSIDSINADSNFNDVGRARGVRGAREFSTGNKGKLVGSAK